MDWSSESLYDGKLNAHASVAEHLLKDLEGVQEDENTGNDNLALLVTLAVLCTKCIECSSLFRRPLGADRHDRL